MLYGLYMEILLDRRVQFDERSRNFPSSDLRATEMSPRSYTWGCPINLDQGSQGACVGFSWSQELAARPVMVGNITNRSALAVYAAAKTLDEYPGENYSGTSVIAGAKAIQALGHLTEYRWAFGLTDLISAVGRHGPAVLGVNWYEGMFNVADGRVTISGDVAGGHAILCRGVNIASQTFLLHNSWGRDWGVDGCARISFADMERLLNESGEACIPVRRR